MNYADDRPRCFLETLWIRSAGRLLLPDAGGPVWDHHVSSHHDNISTTQTTKHGTYGCLARAYWQ
jgi:hypothetical protein